MQEQARQLRAALNENARQSRKVAKQIRKASNDLLKRGENLTDELTERGSKLTADLAKQSKKVANNLAERRGTFWTILGFSLGLTAALVATYLFVRQRFIQQQEEPDQQIELPQMRYQDQIPPATETVARSTTVQ